MRKNSKKSSQPTLLTQKVYQALKKIPRGKVTTYKALAESVGTKGYRAVGNILNKNPDAPATPCHRVVSSSGHIGGYAFGIKKKIALLKKEGVLVLRGKKSGDFVVKDFEKHLV